MKIRMKLFIKITLFVFVAFVTNVKVMSATTTFSNIQKTTVSFSFHTEIPKAVFKILENDLQNCRQNEQNLMNYRNKGKGVAIVDKAGNRVFEVGSYNNLRGVEAELDAHHMRQSIRKLL